MKKFLAGLALLAVTGCSTIKTDVLDKGVTFVGNDLQRTSDMAAKYNKPGVKQCADFMLAQVAKLQTADSNLAALQAEKTEGLLSAALKAALIADALKSLQDANGPQFKAEFQAACSKVAGDILFNIMQDAAKVGKRGF